MLFKDEAEALVAKWENIRDGDDLELLAAQTAVALTRVTGVPAYVLDALDTLLDLEYKKRGRCVYDVVGYLRALAEDCRPKRAAAPIILQP